MDEFRVIENYELATLLGINDLDRPGEGPPGKGWQPVWYVPRPSLRDLLEGNDDDFIPDLLYKHITPERYEELSGKIKALTPNQMKSRRASLDFITKEEKEIIDELYMEREVNSDTDFKVDYYTITAPDGKKLTFQISIGDSGEPYDLKTPYDQRDGGFVDLSDSLIVEDRR
jgi:hypothetical protein